MAKGFIAGILKHAPEICLVTNQWYNSYKRLVPGFEAPVYLAWAQRNRSALVRVPQYKPGKEDATRIEARFPDAACNPYLAFAAMLGAGIKGVEEDYALAEPVNGDLYKMSHAEREDIGVGRLPGDLFGAVQAAMKSRLMEEILGSETLDHLVMTKLQEDMSHRLHVTKKELGDYLKL
jgi:glutamine synthetase